jgi:FkbM family methyltransferase
VSLSSKIAAALKPEYVFQPRVLMRRLRNGEATGHGPTRYEIPGGATIEALAEEEHGRILATLGVVDLPVTEALWRLATRNETCLDVGANIGYMTGVLAGRMHGGGTIHSFEAMPTIFEELERNVALIRARFPNVQIHTHAAAVSSEAGTLRMEMPHGFDTNRGLAKVGDAGDIEVPAVKLDDVFDDDTKFGVMKLDVEGHELAVLRGAEKMFAAKRVRDCVFEEHRAFPTDVTTWFEEHGYTVFRITRPLWRPSLVDPRIPHEKVDWLPVSYVATAEKFRAKARFTPMGWASLRGFKD